MAQHSSIGVSVRGPLDRLACLVAALAVAMAAIGLVTSGEAFVVVALVVNRHRMGVVAAIRRCSFSPSTGPRPSAAHRRRRLS
jgi:hypothetical protein